MEEKGFVHIYTGNGKGKTTAAIGLAIRAIGANKKVYIGQFIKSMKYSEVKVLEKIKNITIEQFGDGCRINQDFTENDKKSAKDGLQKVKTIIKSNNYDVVILDEICVALYYKLLDLNEVIDLIKQKPNNIELILTGRYATKELIDLADLVTNCAEVKHYYKQGVLSRKGIDC